MDSYVFKTENGELGYFQKDGEECAVYVGTEPIDRFIEAFFQEESEGRRGVPRFNSIIECINYYLLMRTNCGTIEENNLHKCTTDAGSFFYRMARNNSGLYEYMMSENSFVDEVRAYYNIIDMLNELFKVIEPTQTNLVSYGHKIREVLILACTEVEYLLKKFLMDNGRKSQGNFYTTRDYVKALEPLKLNKYVIKLKMHPSLDPLSPFKDWVDEKGQTTKSLPWYDAYNSVKHDRGGSFEKASLGSLINAVGAIHILLEAQYGKEIFDKPFHSSYESCFQTEVLPAWEINDLQVPIIQIDWSSKKLVWDKKLPFFNS